MKEECRTDTNSIIKMKDWMSGSLARDESQQIRIDDFFPIGPPAKLGGADISIVVDFNPWFVPITWRLEYRFQTRAEADGSMSWVPRPVGK
jgi:hypothetical protein